MHKFVVTDLDGTLLNSERNISEINTNTINDLFADDYIICFATGRTLHSTLIKINHLNINPENCYIICNTGSRVYHYKDLKLLSSNTINKDHLQEIHSYTKNSNVLLSAYTDEKIYVFDDKLNDAIVHDAQLLAMNITISNNETFDDDICRINVMGTKEDISSAIKDIPNNVLEKYYFVQNEKFSFEILNKNAGKANALSFLTKYLNIDLSYSFIIGDNYNDYDMLKLSKESIAMGQSNDDIKKVCKYTTLSNDEEGFTYAINNYLNK